MSLFHNRLLPPALAVYALVSLAAHAQTQAAMNEDACAQYKNADQALNATYMKVLKDYGRDPQFLAKLKQATSRDRLSRRASRCPFPEGRQAG
jgi:uncharacterized protein YecT (DUF1311 family)